MEAIHAERSRFIGVSATFALPGGEEIAVLAGLDSKREQTPLKTSHKFLSGSVGKTDVTASAQRWIQAGKLKLEDKAATGVARYAFISGADGKSCGAKRIARRWSRHRHRWGLGRGWA